MNRTSRASRAQHGGILLTTIVFAVIISTVLAGLGTLIMSFYSRVNTEAQFASTINLADAGANYELRKINESVTNADLPTEGTPPGVTIALGAGTFRVYCTMADGVTAWDKTAQPFCIISTGTIGQVSRTIKVSTTGLANTAGGACLFAMSNGAVGTGNPTISGSVATNGTLDFVTNPAVTGNVSFYGPNAAWSPVPGGTYNTVNMPNAVAWPTVTQAALSQFPDSGPFSPGGLSYIAAHNDNALASPPIVGSTVSLSGASTETFVGKPGGANYYVTNLETAGSSNLVFDNSAGPITIWQGTSTGTFTVNGGAASVKMATDATKPVKIYAATTSGVMLNGAAELDAGVYNVTGGTASLTIGGSASIYGTIVCDNFQVNGSGTLYAISGYFTAPGQSTYQYNNSWLEENSL